VLESGNLVVGCVMAENFLCDWQMIESSNGREKKSRKLQQKEPCESLMSRRGFQKGFFYLHCILAL